MARRKGYIVPPRRKASGLLQEWVIEYEPISPRAIRLTCPEGRFFTAVREILHREGKSYDPLDDLERGLLNRRLVATY